MFQLRAGAFLPMLAGLYCGYKSVDLIKIGKFPAAVTKGREGQRRAH
jgi:hypothetical protein